MATTTKTRRQPQEDYHEGPAIHRFTDTHFLELCPFGHLVSSYALGRDFAGSAGESVAAAPHRTVRCYGAMQPAQTLKTATLDGDRQMGFEL